MSERIASQSSRPVAWGGVTELGLGNKAQVGALNTLGHNHGNVSKEAPNLRPSQREVNIFVKKINKSIVGNGISFWGPREAWLYCCRANSGRLRNINCAGPNPGRLGQRNFSFERRWPANLFICLQVSRKWICFTRVCKQWSEFLSLIGGNDVRPFQDAADDISRIASLKLSHVTE